MKKLITPAFLMVVVILVLAEVIVRLFFAQDISGRFAYGYDPQAGFDERRDGTVQLFRAGGRRTNSRISATMASSWLTSSAMMDSLWRDLSSRPGTLRSCRANPPMMSSGFLISWAI